MRNIRTDITSKPRLGLAEHDSRITNWLKDYPGIKLEYSDYDEDAPRFEGYFALKVAKDDFFKEQDTVMKLEDDFYEAFGSDYTVAYIQKVNEVISKPEEPRMFSTLSGYIGNEGEYIMHVYCNREINEKLIKQGKQSLIWQEI